MCIEDVRLNRQENPNQTVVSVGNTSVDLVPGNLKRTKIIISAPLTNRITISMKEIAVLDEGLNLYPSSKPLELTLDCYGSIVTRKLTVIAAAGTETIGVWESELLTD